MDKNLGGDVGASSKIIVIGVVAALIICPAAVGVYQYLISGKSLNPAPGGLPLPNFVDANASESFEEDMKAGFLTTASAEALERTEMEAYTVSASKTKTLNFYRMHMENWTRRMDNSFTISGYTLHMVTFDKENKQAIVEAIEYEGETYLALFVHTLPPIDTTTSLDAPPGNLPLPEFTVANASEWFEGGLKSSFPAGIEAETYIVSGSVNHTLNFYKENAGDWKVYSENIYRMYGYDYNFLYLKKGNENAAVGTAEVYGRVYLVLSYYLW